MENVLDMALVSMESANAIMDGEEVSVTSTLVQVGLTNVLSEDIATTALAFVFLDGLEQTAMFQHALLPLLEPNVLDMGSVPTVTANASLDSTVMTARLTNVLEIQYATLPMESATPTRVSVCAVRAGEVRFVRFESAQPTHPQNVLDTENAKLEAFAVVSEAGRALPARFPSVAGHPSAADTDSV